MLSDVDDTWVVGWAGTNACAVGAAIRSTHAATDVNNCLEIMLTVGMKRRFSQRLCLDGGGLRCQCSIMETEGRLYHQLQRCVCVSMREMGSSDSRDGWRGCVEWCGGISLDA